jgi:predicted MPP superfamily phosphohydrolase
MRILHVTDLHADSLWFDWVANHCGRYDLLAISGDLLDAFSKVPLVEQVHAVQAIIHGRTYRNRAELAAAVAIFVITYNREWRLEKRHYKNPIDEARLAYQPSSPLAA